MRNRSFVIGTFTFLGITIITPVISLSEELTVQRIPRHSIVDPRGNPLPVSHYTAFNLVLLGVPALAVPPPEGIALAVAPSTPATDIIIGDDNPINDPSANQTDIQNTLKLLSSNFPDYKLFKSYLLAIPEDSNLTLLAKSTFGAATPGAPKTPQSGTLDIWALGQVGAAPSDGSIQAVWERQLIAAPDNNAFVLQGNGSEFNPDNAYFFALDGFAANVPYNAYKIAVSDFTSGLVTRLVLGNIARAAGFSDADVASKLDFPEPNMGAFKANTFDALPSTIWLANQGITSVVNKAILNSPFRPQAMMYGWYAGQIFDHSNDTHKKAIWHLLSFRYNYRLLGESIGYTLNYLEGYRRGQLFKVFGTAALGLDNSIMTFDLCVGSVVQGKTCSGGQQFSGPALLNEQFFSLLIYLYTKAENDNGLNNKQRTSVGSFIIGFNEGSLRAASVSYGEIFSLGYNLGYSAGYRDGYTRGYQDGYRDGYAAAPSFDLAGVFGVIKQVQGVISTAGSVVSAVEAIASLL